MNDHPETDPDFVPGFGPVPGSGFGIDADPDFGPEAFKTHSPGCTCPDCAAELDRENAQQIGYLNKMLAESVANASVAAAMAAKWLRELISPAVYDIEFAEGPAGPDALADLEAAGKLLRNVERIVHARLGLLEEDR
jgi:hypothetical protein